MESVSLYSEARNEYLKQLSTWIIPPLVEFFRKEYASISAKEGRRTMTVFQTWCSEIPRWNQDVIDINIGILLDTCRCDYVEELMTAVFIAHTKMLTAIRVNSRQKKLQITLPKLDHFLHRVFVECARAFWKAPFLFADELSPIEKQKNVLQAESMCTEALSGAVRSLLPVKSILRDYLEEDDEEEEEKPVVAKSSTKSSKKSPKPVESDSESESEAEPEAEAEPEVEAEAEPEVESAQKGGKLEEQTIETDDIDSDEIVSEPVMESVKEPEPILESIKEPEPVKEFVKETETVTEPVNDPNTKIFTPISRNVKLVKEETETAITKEEAVPSTEVVIDTEPSVHFTPYDTVYDENTENVSEIRYAPKISIEDLPDSNWGYDQPLPRINISSEESSVDAEDLEPSQKPVPPQEYEDEDVDIPLSMTGDFEELS